MRCNSCPARRRISRQSTFRASPMPSPRAPWGDRGQAILDVGDADVAAVVALLNASKRFVGRPAETGVSLLVDGQPFAPSAEDPFLSATPGLEWLPDGAALAFLTMGDPLEVRNVSAEVVERRMRAIRIRRCKTLSLVVGDVEAIAQGADRIQAFPHNSRPSLIIAGEAPMSWPLLLEAAPSISKLLGSGVKSLEMMLAATERAVGSARPTLMGSPRPRRRAQRRLCTRTL